MAKPCTPHLIPQAAQLFKIETANVGGRGGLPSRSLGGSRGPFSHVREWPPYCALPHAAGEPKTQPLRAAPPSAPAGCPKPRSRAYVASAEPRSALKSGRNALHFHASFGSYKKYLRIRTNFFYCISDRNSREYMPACSSATNYYPKCFIHRHQHA